MTDMHKKTLWQKCVDIFRPKPAGAEEALRMVKDRGEEVHRAIVERRMQERARKGIHLGSFTVPESWRTLTFADLRVVHAQSLLTEGAKDLSDKDWGLLQYAGRAFAEDGRTLLVADIDALSTLVEEGETEDTLTLITLFERVQERLEHKEHMLVQTLKVKGRG